MFDLVLKGGRVIDPSQGYDSILDVAISGDAPDAEGEIRILRRWLVPTLTVRDGQLV